MDKIEQIKSILAESFSAKVSVVNEDYAESLDSEDMERIVSGYGNDVEKDELQSAIKEVNNLLFNDTSSSISDYDGGLSELKSTVIGTIRNYIKEQVKTVENK